VRYKDDPFFRALEEIEPDYTDTAMGPAYTITRAAAILRLNPRAFSAWLNGMLCFPALSEWNNTDFKLTRVFKSSGPRDVVPRVTVYEIKKAMERGRQPPRPALKITSCGRLRPTIGA
jgi:hypothetical protein